MVNINLLYQGVDKSITIRYPDTENEKNHIVKYDSKGNKLIESYNIDSNGVRCYF